MPVDFAAEGLESYRWSNGPGHRYAAHSHPYHKVLICDSGSITFHTADGDIVLRAGDRMDLPAGTEHSASVGESGVVCWEAARY
ncbi:MAG: AraC family ligand binding domain-containing protein [Acidimicrobiia bacterium]